ncbi:hypothetical protein AVEN_163238-1 [Araneus ventricosus]|uniref:Uncharacterized protein n=1 Tax=Araneus ventricosus TaxID=182803 RepID=A0A4Y2L573_ARAVE|nr:hypothetical protein AVEN_163238-1 [Araneus ventricosus]
MFDKLVLIFPLFFPLDFEEKQRLKREETMSRPLFPSSHKSMPVLASSIRETKMKELLKPLTKTELGITLKNERENAVTSSSNESEKPKESSDLKTSLVACDYDSSDSDKETI